MVVDNTTYMHITLENHKKSNAAFLFVHFNLLIIILA
jgi:hypothetical protein